MSERVTIRKTYKLFVNGAFIRSESGRTDAVGGENIARGSRKDVRDAVVAARAAHEKWSSQTPYNRGQVLYRLAEMMEARRASIAEQLVIGGTVDATAAHHEVAIAIDRVVYYAGWCDKYAALASSRNPVAGPFLNVTAPEPVGIVGILAPKRPALVGLISLVLPVLVAGNSAIVVGSEEDPRSTLAFAECVATSDLPAGVLNLIAGEHAELGPVLASHMDINAIAAAGAEPILERRLAELAAENVTRTHFESCPDAREWMTNSYDRLERVLAYTEQKTVWHPAGYAI
jgi:acyl-CoA reductase-like NAD-dependent aldehyde dehydrogenase